MSLWSSLRPEYAVMFQNLGFNDINIFEEVSFQINDILISSTEKDLYLYTLWQDALLEVLLTLSLKRNIFFHFLKDCLNTNYCLSYKAGLDMFMWGNVLPFRIKKEYA